MPRLFGEYWPKLAWIIVNISMKCPYIFYHICSNKNFFLDNNLGCPNEKKSSDYKTVCQTVFVGRCVL